MRHSRSIFFSRYCAMSLGDTEASFMRRLTTSGVTPNAAATSSTDLPMPMSLAKARNSSAGCIGTWYVFSVRLDSSPRSAGTTSTGTG